MIKVVHVSNRTMPKIKAYFLEHNNGTLADWEAWYQENRERMLVVEEKDPQYPENIAWVTLSRAEFESMYNLKTYAFGSENSPHYCFIECVKHGLNPITQCWRKILAYPDYEVNGAKGIRKVDDQDGDLIMQFRGRRDIDTEGWYAKLVPQHGFKKEMVWLDNHIADHNLGEAEYKA